MRILHTSDWHLGRMLYGQRRTDEFEAFLHWLTGFIKEQSIDVLLVAGDVFDTTTPGNRVQEMYYQFLSRVKTTNCRHVVVIAGNHDSPTLLNAPANLLKSLNIHVVGEASDDGSSELITLCNQEGQPEAIVCAVPFLRDRDVRVVGEDETSTDKTRNLIQGIAAHYHQIAARAEELNTTYPIPVPVLAMGHLFTAGGSTVEGDGTRDLYVGTAVQVGKDIFPDTFDYVALGHLHTAQLVSGDEYKCYSGSPLPMGFNEANQVKKVIIVEFNGKQPTVTEHRVPVFKTLLRISGSVEQIIEKLRMAKESFTEAYLELECTSQELVSELTGLVANEIEGVDFKVLRLKNKMLEDQVITRMHATEELADLDPREVFERCLQQNAIEEDRRKELRDCYLELLAEYETYDKNA